MRKAMRALLWMVAALLLSGISLAAAAWFSPPIAEKLFEWSGRRNEPVPPLRIADNLYYVGASDAASFLLTGDKGHVLIDGGYESTTPQILRSIRALGFDPRDVRIILNTHGHFDHAAGIAALKGATGARLYASAAEKILIEAGGRGDYRYGDHLAYPLATVDHVLVDRETIRLGSITLTAHVTPGHTKGCTSWKIPLTVAGQREPGLLICSLSLTGSPLSGDPAYPNIAADYESSFRRLKGLPCRIFLMPHARTFGLAAKSVALAKGDQRAFVDPNGCATFIADQEKAFREKLR